MLGCTPRVLFGLSQSWEPLLHVIPHPSWVNSVVFSPDGGRLASGSDQIVRIWNTVTGELEDELEGHTKWVWSMAFSHNGRFIVSGSADETVRIWNTATRETTYMLTGHTSEVRSVAISRNEEFVVSGSYDRTVRTWDTATGELLYELKGHADQVMSVAISPDCQHIASGSGNEVWIWTKDGVIEHKLESLPTNNYIDLPYDLAFSHDGCRILCNINRTEWTTTGHRLSPPGTNNHYYLTHIRSLAYSPDDGDIVCGMFHGKIMIWNRETNKRHILSGHLGMVRSVAFSPDGSRIASGSEDGTVRIWDPRLGGMINEEVHSGWLIALSHDGRWIMTASLDYIQVWRVTETVRKANKLRIKTDMESLALSRDGSRVVIGCQDGSIRVWNHLKNTIECHIGGHSNHAWSVVWNHLTNIIKHQISGHSDYVSFVAFSYDESHIVSGSRDMTVRIWDCHTGNAVGLYQHSNEVTCVAFSRDGGRVVFGSIDGVVRIWNPSTGQIHSKAANMSKRQPCWVRSVAFSHDGNHIIISGWGNSVWIWNVTTNESAMLSERIQLPDGTRVHPISNGGFHIYDPVDQEMTNDIPPYLLSISPDHDWITGVQAEHKCWIPTQYLSFFQAHIAKSIVCLQSDSNMIVLDLKSTHQNVSCQ